MSEDMVERIEDAIFDAIEAQEILNASILVQDGKMWIIGEAGIDLGLVARAAIEAIREISDAQICDAGDANGYGAGGSWTEDLRRNWAAICDAALTPPRVADRP